MSPTSPQPSPGASGRPLGVAVVSDQLGGFPRGYAAAQYVRLLAKGLAAAGADVNLLVPASRDSADGMSGPGSASGTIDGFHYEHTTDTAVASPHRLARRWARLRSRWVLPRRLIALRRQGRLDAIVLYSRTLHLLRGMLRLRRILHVPVVVQMVEWPPACDYQPPAQRRAEQAFCEWAFARADGFILISRFLEQRCQDAMSRHGRPRPCLRLPVMMDPADWVGVVPARRERPYLLFCAHLDNYLADARFILESCQERICAPCMRARGRCWRPCPTPKRRGHGSRASSATT